MSMLDVGEKKVTLRQATVEAKIYIKSQVIELIKKNELPKGNVLETAKIAGIMAAKKTPFIIPLCHPISIEYATVDFLVKESSIEILSTIRGTAKTGVEMEAFAAASLAALTIYDMCKALDRDITISEIRLLKKTGGKSGDYSRKSANKKV